jgi:23S rRNA (pseudouridine1915-N3)-methyltransferase
MKISLIAVGKRMPDWVTAGFQEYVQRLPADYAIKLIEISATKRTKGADINRLLQGEGEKILAAIPSGDRIIALTERGQLWDTQGLAQQLQIWRDGGCGLSLLVGGPEGLPPACLARAHHRWSLSPLTFPHPLVRILIAEQIYRAYSLLHNHPYHRA